MRHGRPSARRTGTGTGSQPTPSPKRLEGTSECPECNGTISRIVQYTQCDHCGSRLYWNGIDGYAEHASPTVSPYINYPNCILEDVIDGELIRVYLGDSPKMSSGRIPSYPKATLDTISVGSFSSHSERIEREQKKDRRMIAKGTSPHLPYEIEDILRSGPCGLRDLIRLTGQSWDSLKAAIKEMGRSIFHEWGFVSRDGITQHHNADLNDHIYFLNSAMPYVRSGRLPGVDMVSGHDIHSEDDLYDENEFRRTKR